LIDDARGRTKTERSRSDPRSNNKNKKMSLRRGVVAALGRQQLLWAAAQQRASEQAAR
jgi:hypothetical protein